MNLEVALRAYARASVTGLSARDIEADVLDKASRLLRAAQLGLPDFTPCVEALRFNQSFWTIVQADAASEHSPLASELRASLLSLGRFVDTQTRLVLAEPTALHLQPLIDINQHLVAGLRQPSPTGEEQGGGR